MDAAHHEQPSVVARSLERAQALLTLLPAAILLWPGARGPLDGDPGPELTGAAVAALATIPALAMTLVRRASWRAPWAAAFVAAVALGLASLLTKPPADTLEASRAMLLATASFALVVCGASLGEIGRATLARGLVVLSHFALVPALYGVTPRHSGMLGNTGATSEIALLGALAGLVLFARNAGVWGWIGFATVVLQALYCGLAPVFAGALVLALAFVLVTSARARRTVAVLAVLAVATFCIARASTWSFPAGHASQAHVTSNAAGVGVRTAIWRRTALLAVEHPMLGVGPGQFAAQFPPYRDPAEIELSSQGHTLSRQETEVEHAHSDFLQAFADGGILGGIAWFVFAAAVAWRSWRALRARDADAGALGLVALGVLANAALREPLFWNAASACAAFAVFGATLRPSAMPSRASMARLAIVLLVLIVLAAQIPRAWRIVEHGNALAAYLRDKHESQLDRARAACPDSIAVRSLDARALDRRDDAATRAATIDAWQSVLAIRPHRIEALVNLGIAYAKDERIEAAREAWQHAFGLDPRNSTVWFAFARLEALQGEPQDARPWMGLAGMNETGAWRNYAADALSELRIERGWSLFARADARFEHLDADNAYRLARDESLGLAPLQARALEGSAHVAWARVHAANGDPAAAVRSYRQAKRGLNLAPNDSAPPRWHANLHLELAAALSLDGKLDDARTELDGVTYAACDLVRLPEWAGQVLLREQLLAGTAQ